MNRRNFLLAGLSFSLTACLAKNKLLNPCLDRTFPQHLKNHLWYQQAWKNIDPTQVWDSHVHLLGAGDPNQSWVNPKMQSLLHPIYHTQFEFYLNASCIKTSNETTLNDAFIQRLIQQLAAFPKGVKLMLMAFDYSYDEQGQKHPEQTAYYIANDYAAKVAKKYPQYFEWIGSVHPYRPDALEALEKVIERGAKAIKWLPPVMGIDPLSEKCKPFYKILAQHKIPLLTHAGEEKAIFGRHLPDAGNPLRLRAALDQGARVIVAHCGALGESHDLDRKSKRSLSSFQLFSRLMDDPNYHDLLLADISAMPQKNRVGSALQTVIQRQDWHSRLLNGSDYPLPGIVPLFSLDKLVDLNLLDQAKVDYLAEVREYNALLFDFLLKRHLNYQNKSFLADTFMTKKHFT